MRDEDTFAQAIEPPGDATPLLRLVAFSGRKIATPERGYPIAVVITGETHSGGLP